MRPDGLPPWAATCLDILRSVGARVTPAAQPRPGAALYRVELPEAVACRRWGTPYRPHPPLLLSFAGRQETCAETLEPPGPQAEPVTPLSRRAADIVELALDPGWVGVFHESPRAGPHRARGSSHGSVPALWALLEAVADGGPLAQVPPPCWLAGWVDLARPANPAWCGRLGQSPHGPGPWADRLPVRPGPPAAVRSRRAARRALRLPAAWRAIMEQAVRSLAQDAAMRRWRDALGGDRHDAGAGARPEREDPRLQLFVTMAAVVYLDPARPWPPPALPWPEPSSG